MRYPVEYIRMIAEFKFGKSSRAVNEYVRRFDPKDPACLRDELLWFAAFGKDDTIAESRMKMRVENYFIDHLIYNFVNGEWHTLYGSFERGTAKQSAELITERMRKWLAATFTEGPEEVDESVSYGALMARFSERYGVHLSPEAVRAAISDLSALPSEDRIPLYRRYYKGIFLAAYAKTEGKAKIEKMFADFDEVIGAVIKSPEPTGKAYPLPRRGGMTGADVKDFLLGALQTECDLSHKARESVRDLSGNAATVKVMENFGEVLSDKKMPEDEKLARCVSLLQALQQKHARRGTVRRITSPARYRKESRDIAALKKMLTDRKFDPVAIEKMSAQTVYKPGYKKDVTDVEAFCHELDAEKLDGGLFPEDEFAENPPTAQESLPEKDAVSEKEAEENPIVLSNDPSEVPEGPSDIR